MVPLRHILIALAPLLGLALAQPVTTQQLRPLLGRVVDDNGDGMANATVHMAFSPIGSKRNRALRHEVAISDKRGRFRFRAQPCTTHMLWAIGPANEDGQRLVSAIEHAAPGRLLELRAKHLRPICTLTIEGLDKWPEKAPFRIRVAPGTVELANLEFPLDEDGTCTLPPLPAGRTSIDILDKHGQPLQGASISPANAAESITLQPPQTVPMVVNDAKGKPVANAIVRQRLRGGWSDSVTFGPSRPQRYLWRELGKTDDEGKLIAKIANRKNPFGRQEWQHLFFTANKAGYRGTHSGFSDRPYFDGQEVAVEGVEVLQFTLHQAAPTTYRLMLDAQQALADQPVVVSIGLLIKDQDTDSSMHESLVHRATTDAEGRFEVPDLANATDDIRLLIGGQKILTKLVPEKLQRMTPYRAVSLHRLTAKADQEKVLTLGNLPTLQIRLLDEGGGPVTDAEVMLISMARKGDYDCDAWSTLATTDNAGRLALQVQPGKWLLFVRNKTSMAHANLNLDGDKKLSLRLSEMPAMLGRVVDEDGKPIAQAEVRCHTYSSWTNSDDGNPGLVTIANHLNWKWINNTRTDQDGNFACRFLKLPGMSYHARMRHDGKTSPDFEIVPSKDRVTFTLK